MPKIVLNAKMKNIPFNFSINANEEKLIHPFPKVLVWSDKTFSHEWFLTREISILQVDSEVTQITVKFLLKNILYVHYNDAKL